MKRFAFCGCLLGCFLAMTLGSPTRVFAAPDDSNPATLELTHSLPPGGTLVLTLNVGDLRIVSSPDANGIRVEIRGSASQEEERSWVRQFEVAGDRATVEIQAPKNHEHCVSCYSDRDVTVYVPQQTALKLKVEVGDVSINGIQGDKQIQLGIGDLSLAVGNPGEYGEIDLSTRIGDVDDSVYHSAANGFLGKSQTITRQGRYHLRAHVGIGDLKLTQSKG